MLTLYKVGLPLHIRTHLNTVTKEMGIGAADIQKLRAAGLGTVMAILSTTKKVLTRIKVRV